MNELKTRELYSLEHTIARELLENTEYPWEILSKIGDFIIRTGEALSKEEYYTPQKNVWIARSAEVAPSATIKAPCIICGNAQIRQCAFIRGNVIVGKECVVGNSTELKNCILFDNVQVPHFNYVGDSILGWRAHMGAGAVTSNVKNDKAAITIKAGTLTIETGLRKLGAMIGDMVEVGCNSVINPGSVIGKNTWIYPLSCVRGVISGNSIYKSSGIVVPKT